MRDTMKVGVTQTTTVKVDADRTISFLGEDLRVYSTPSMVHDVEYAGVALIEQHLEAGEGTVGIHIAVDHIAATPLGEDVSIHLEVTEVDGAKVTIKAEVRDALELVGQGTHVRFVIDVERQAGRLQKKKAALAAL